MNSKNLFSTVLLFSIAVVIAFANGPMPVNTAEVADGAVTTAKIADGAVTAAKTDGTLMLTDGSNASDAATVRSNIDVYSVGQVDAHIADTQALLQQGNLRYYFTKDSTIANTFDFAFTPPANATEAATLTISATTATSYCDPHITPAGSPGVVTLPAGEISYSLFGSLNQALSTGRFITMIPELYYCDSDGSNPVLIATGTSHQIEGTAVQAMTGRFVLAADVSIIDATKRLRFQLYFYRTGVTTGADPILTLYCGGQYAGIMSLALPSAVVMKTDGSNADGGIYRAIATGTILAAADTITVSIATSKINTASPKFILRVGGTEHIYPHNHAITSVTDDGTDVTITLDAAVATDRNWSLLTLSDNL